MSASEAAVRAALGASVRHLHLLHAFRAIAFGAGAGAVLSALVRWTSGSVLGGVTAGIPAAAAVATIYVRRTAGARTPATAARLIERHRPEFRNLLITSEELIRTPARAREWIRSRVMDDASAIIGSGIPVTHGRLTGGALLAAASLLAWGASLSSLHRPAVETVRDTLASARSVMTGTPRIRVTVTPPSYAGAGTFTLTDPERIEVLEGGRLHVSVSGSETGWRVRLGTSELSVSRDGSSWSAGATVTSSGYLAVELLDGSPTARRLIAVVVTPDRVPAITVETPGRDLLFPDAAHRIPVRATASDDLGLRSFELRYTKVSGTGEQFDFVEGTLPVAVARSSATTWRGDSEIALAALGFEKGDSLVYRLVARDGRPGDEGLGASDTYFVEIAAPGQVALAGMDLPPDQDRYGLSQQMIVLKIERLRAREATMTAGERRAQLENLAAEQRAVRANFIFLMGGHVEDEEEEAEQSHEIQEGRLENRARRDIAAAVRHMTLAERGLAALSASAALPRAKAAVDALQRAFGHSRYFLRAAPLRGRIDPSRRLSGELRSMARWLRSMPSPPDDTPPARARALIARLRSLQSPGGAKPSPEIARLAEEALAVDPSSPDWQEISRALSRQGVDAALALLHRQAGKDTLPQSDALARRSRLWSAWAEARR